MNRLFLVLLLLVLIIIVPSLALAYVDPGIISVFYQLIYVVVFGFLATLIFKPYKYVKNLFQRTFGYRSEAAPNEKAQSENGDEIHQSPEETNP